MDLAPSNRIDARAHRMGCAPTIRSPYASALTNPMHSSHSPATLREQEGAFWPGAGPSAATAKASKPLASSWDATEPVWDAEPKPMAAAATAAGNRAAATTSSTLVKPLGAANASWTSSPYAAAFLERAQAERQAGQLFGQLQAPPPAKRDVVIDGNNVAIGFQYDSYVPEHTAYWHGYISKVRVNALSRSVHSAKW